MYVYNKKIDQKDGLVFMVPLKSDSYSVRYSNEYIRQANLHTSNMVPETHGHV